jgi:hypothetical protein
VHSKHDLCSIDDVCKIIEEYRHNWTDNTVNVESKWQFPVFDRDRNSQIIFNHGALQGKLRYRFN